jgi:outer membrane protein insertion porin family
MQLVRLSVFILIAGSGLCAPVSGVTEFLGKRIHNIRYRAEQPLDQVRYGSMIRLKPGDVLTRTGLKEAIQALYDTGRFSSIIVEGSEEKGDVGLLFRLHLNYYFSKFIVRGHVDFRGRAPWEWISFPIGEHYTARALEETRQAVLKYLKEQGYFLAEVGTDTARDDAARRIDVAFDVDAGKLATVSSLQIRGVPSPEIKGIQSRFGFKEGKKYDRKNLRRRMDSLKRYLMKRGYLAASPELSESFVKQDNSVSLLLQIANFGKIRIAVDGFKIEKTRLRRLLPPLSGEGVEPDLLEEGVRNLRDYLEEQGYPEAVVSIRRESDRSGTLVLRYNVEAGRKVTVAYVHFRGNRAFSEAELLRAVDVQPARFLQKSVYSVSRLDSSVESLRALYRSRGYLEAEMIPLVEPVRGAEKLGITFECTERSLSHSESVTITGNRALRLEALRTRMELKAGGPYSINMVERDRQALLAAYNDAGFLQARVTYRVGIPNPGGGYRVGFDIDEGIQALLDDILVFGGEQTRPSVIHKRIKLRKDDPLSLGRLLETQKSLYGTGVFDLVRVSPQNPDSTTPYQNVVVRLQEADRVTLRYGLGYEEREKLRGTIEWSNLNVLGTGQRADLRLRGSRIDQTAILTFQQPQFRFLPVNSYLTFLAQQKQEVSFDQKRLELSYQFGRPINDHTWALLRYSFRKVRVSNVQAEPGREDAPRNLSTVSAIYLNDTRDNYLDPEKGFFTSTDLSLTTKLLGSNNYYSLFTQNSYYKKLRGSLLAAVSLRLGLAHPFGGDTSLPISERFFAGGSSSLRGFETDLAGPLDPVTNAPMGGNALIVGNLELRLPLWRSVHIAPFYDTGNVFSTVSDISLSGFSHTAGLGLRLKTPFGPLRVDYGFNLNLPATLRNQGLKPGHLFVTVGPPF